MTRLLLLLIGFYQRWISPAFGPRCRFYPSCSSYAATSLTRHGLLHGGALAVRRIGRCHPWNPGGPDPVPPVPRHSYSRTPLPPCEGDNHRVRLLHPTAQGARS